MKFVAHDSTIAHDFVSNFNLFVDTLVHIIGVSPNGDTVEKARGFLKLVKDEVFMLDVWLLASITRLLKRFSTAFQVSSQLAVAKNLVTVKLFQFFSIYVQNSLNQHVLLMHMRTYHINHEYFSALD